MEEAGIRLNKMLSEAGVCSRREADRLIEAGRITVDGVTASMGQRILPGQQVLLDGKAVGGKERPVLLLVNKPAGVVCTTAEFKNEKNIVDMVDYPVRLYPVGRLDKESEGLILMTNQGDLMNKILRPGNAHQKEYLVKVNRPVTPEFLEAMRRGVPILGTVTAPCQVEKTGSQSFRIILTQGLNRQIRRMCEYFGYRVAALKRVRVLNFVVDGIPLGGYREATEAEMRSLRELLRDSSGKPYKER
ncbi:pseudouridine synthase [Fusibacillus kribbianus]|uniref:Pseudouridine synthase n=1 Tax=Fusibacillus kribbianus TaxID=3044208 RepID=A0AAP4EZV2_9FIRM|nr:pseudouridine synthase [Ruminococcus sp. YH-rum2234]MDI9242320.1 pseudouridine synthase [Ruminococcus sp. YH-rum2234]